MAFVCLIDNASLYAEVFKEENSYSILIRVGEDTDAGKNYFVNVGLTPSPGTGHLEYYFCLVEVCCFSQEEDVVHWSGKNVAYKISKEDRATILRVVLNSTAHYAISQVFEDCGYSVVTADPYKGKRVWWMERNEPPKG